MNKESEVNDIIKSLATDGQRNKYRRIRTYFENLIRLKNKGVFFLIDDEIWREPYINGLEIGFRENNMNFLFVGATHTYNRKTGEFDIPWIDITIKELNERIIPLKRMKLTN